jgi:multidrug resistance protein
MSRPAGPLPPGFGVIWSTVAIDLVGFGIVVPILPLYAERFGVSATVVGALFASFSLAQLVAAPVLGRLSDRIGRKPVLLVSLFGTALGSLLTGLAGDVWVLFAGRILDGASGASVSVAQASVADLAPASQRPRLMGLLGAAFGVGFVAGPAIGALAGLGGPHLPFFVAAAIAFANGVVAVRRLPETHPDRAGGAHREGSSAATADTAETAHTAHTAHTAAGDLGAAPEALSDAEAIADAPALDGPGLVEPGHLEVPAPGGPHGPVVAPRRSELVRLLVVAFVAMVAFSGFEATFGLLAEARLGLTISATAGVFTAIGLALVAVQAGLVGPVSDRLGEAGTLRAGLAANTAGLALLAVDRGWGSVVPALGLLVLGQGLLTPVLSSAVAGRAGAARGAWLGWQQSAGGLARVVGPVAAGALFQHVGVGAPFAAGAVLALGALALVPARKGLSAGWQPVPAEGTVEVTRG